MTNESISHILKRGLSDSYFRELMDSKKDLRWLHKHIQRIKIKYQRERKIGIEDSKIIREDVS